MRKILLTLLTTLLCSVTAWGATAGTPVSIFSTDFSSATAHAYAVSTAENITGAAAGNFDYIASNSKGNCGIAINSSSGGNSVNATGKFQVYANNTSYYWSAVENTNFESDRTGGAPTALKIVISDFFYNCITSGSNIGVDFAIGQGFSNTYSSAPSGVFHSGFSIPSNSTLKFNQFNSTTNLVSTTITLNGSTTITWFINNTGASLTYTGPDGKSYDLADDKFALWTNTTKIVDAGSATTGAKTLTNLYIGSTSGKKHTIYFSGINVYDISPSASCASAPTITVAPSSATYCVGNTATALGYTSATATAQKWQYSTDNSEWNDISPAQTGTTYTPSTASAGTTYYRVIATCDSYTHSATSDPATITVKANHSVTAATSTGNNTYGTVSAASASVCEGGTTTVTATPASGYQVTNWAVTGTGASVSPSGASNSNTTTLTMGTADATVTVTFGCKAPTSPDITGTTAYTEGDDISLTAAATGISASVTYTWYKGATWDAASATSSIHSGATLSINDCVEGDAGTYWCNISNGTGCDVQTSKTITVSGACTDPDLTITLN